MHKRIAVRNSQFLDQITSKDEAQLLSWCVETNVPYAEDATQLFTVTAQGNTVTVYRPNHGTLHAIAHLVLVSRILSLLPTEGKEDLRSIDISDEEKVILCFAGFFCRTGRENEIGGDTEVTARFLKKSAENFLQAMATLNFRPALVQQLAACIQQRPDQEDPKSILFTNIISLAHMLLLHRCFDPIAMQRRCYGVGGHIQQGVQRLFRDPEKMQRYLEDKTLLWLLFSGDRLFSQGLSQYDEERFAHFTHHPMQAIHLCKTLFYDTDFLPASKSPVLDLLEESRLHRAVVPLQRAFRQKHLEPKEGLPYVRIVTTHSNKRWAMGNPFLPFVMGADAIYPGDDDRIGSDKYRYGIGMIFRGLRTMVQFPSNVASHQYTALFGAISRARLQSDLLDLQRFSRSSTAAMPKCESWESLSSYSQKVPQKAIHSSYQEPRDGYVCAIRYVGGRIKDRGGLTDRTNREIWAVSRTGVTYPEALFLHAYRGHVTLNQLYDFCSFFLSIPEQIRAQIRTSIRTTISVGSNDRWEVFPQRALVDGLPKLNAFFEEQQKDRPDFFCYQRDTPFELSYDTREACFMAVFELLILNQARFLVTYSFSDIAERTIVISQ